jgi:hypothetical protein
MDRALPDAAKTVIVRQMAEAETSRTLLLASLDGLREQAAADLDGLAAAVEQAFAEVRESLAGAKTPEAFNRLVDRIMGPVEIDANGGIHQKQLPPVEAEGKVQSNIAGARYEPLHLVRAAVWSIAA